MFQVMKSDVQCVVYALWMNMFVLNTVLLFVEDTERVYVNSPHKLQELKDNIQIEMASVSI